MAEEVHRRDFLAALGVTVGAAALGVAGSDATVEAAETMATYSDDQLEAILDFIVRGRDLLARNTTRVLSMIAERVEFKYEDSFNFGDQSLDNLD